MVPTNATFLQDTYISVPWFGEFCSCCCLPLLPQLACSILVTWERPYSPALYLLTNLRFALHPSLMRGVGEVDDHAESVHLPYHSLAELGEAAVLGGDAGLVHVRAVRPRGVARVRQGQRHGAQSGGGQLKLN